MLLFWELIAGEMLDGNEFLEWNSDEDNIQVHEQ